jgi:hypothetical protein
MRLRAQFVLLVLLLLTAPTFGQPAAAPGIRVAAFGYRNLCFSRDGSLLRVIGESSGDTTPGEHVRAVTYAVKTGAVTHVVNLQPDTRLLSETSDCRTAIVATDASSEHGHLFVLDTGTGQLQAIPNSWYAPDSDLDVDISGDGRLISTYTETGSDTPMTVSVYDWRTKTLIATRTSEFVSAGGIMDGGLTEDGEVEFDGNRVGSKIVDLKTGRVLGQFGLDAMRSPDGKWEVKFPNLNWDEDGPTDVLLEDGMSGKVIGKLDVHIPDVDQNLYGAFGGVFCGVSGRFLMIGDNTITGYTLPSGKRLETIPAQTWREANSPGANGVSAACSKDGKRVAILDGTRLTFHDLR